MNKKKKPKKPLTKTQIQINHICFAIAPALSLLLLIPKLGNKAWIVITIMCIVMTKGDYQVRHGGTMTKKMVAIISITWIVITIAVIVAAIIIYGFQRGGMLQTMAFFMLLAAAFYYAPLLRKMKRNQ
ncbi:MAG: hypothetical protein RR313_04130 [Anaerovoracaceae bacterium]